MIVSVIARQSRAQFRVFEVNLIDDALHLIPFSQSDRQTLAGGFVNRFTI